MMQNFACFDENTQLECIYFWKFLNFLNENWEKLIYESNFTDLTGKFINFCTIFPRFRTISYTPPGWGNRGNVPSPKLEKSTGIRKRYEKRERNALRKSLLNTDCPKNYRPMPENVLVFPTRNHHNKIPDGAYGYYSSPVPGT